MYDRYTLTKSAESLSKSLGVKVPESYRPTYNAAPTQQLPIVTMTLPDQLSFHHWGLISKMANNKAISPKLFNLPAAGLERPAYRKPLEQNRCIIPSDGFYLWKQVGKKQRVPYFAYFPNRDLFAIAGIWEEYEDLDGQLISSFNMITVGAAHVLREYQEDMPALLTVGQIKSWLDPGLPSHTAISILQNNPVTGLHLHAVSPLLNNLQINDERLIKPAPPADQFGNYTLFS